eukprot:2202254-Prymnesium_polylepis.1
MVRVEAAMGRVVVLREMRAEAVAMVQVTKALEVASMAVEAAAAKGWAAVVTTKASAAMMVATAQVMAEAATARARPP